MVHAYILQERLQSNWDLGRLGQQKTSLEEAEKPVLQIVAAYVSKYYPELIDAFGPKGVPAT